MDWRIQLVFTKLAISIFCSLSFLEKSSSLVTKNHISNVNFLAALICVVIGDDDDDDVNNDSVNEDGVIIASRRKKASLHDVELVINDGDADDEIITAKLEL